MGPAQGTERLHTSLNFKTIFLIFVPSKGVEPEWDIARSDQAPPKSPVVVHEVILVVVERLVVANEVIQS